MKTHLIIALKGRDRNAARFQSPGRFMPGLPIKETTHRVVSIKADLYILPVCRGEYILAKFSPVRLREYPILPTKKEAPFQEPLL
ncbi:MAG TPA: hypothetical protein DCX92_07610 [Bacteroidetes bacterium]|nr:hypothetical protein [Bacteroidota bacterium]